jgi:hypothetical protein
METGIHVGTKFDKEFGKRVEEMTASIIKIFESGRKNSMDQETIQLGLTILKNFGTTTAPITVSNCSIMGSSKDDFKKES